MKPIDLTDPFPPAAAAVLASAAFAVPLALSFSSSPTPNHLRPFIWYRTLRQPRFKPPDALIPIAWTALESALAFGGYRLMRAAPSAARRRALGWWTWNVGMIGGWSRLFFGHRNLPASTIAAASMIATGAAYVVEAREVDRSAAAAGVPFVAWVAFATVLTASIWHLNRGR